MNKTIISIAIIAIMATPLAYSKTTFDDVMDLVAELDSSEPMRLAFQSRAFIIKDFQDPNLKNDAFEIMSDDLEKYRSQYKDRKGSRMSFKDQAVEFILGPQRSTLRKEISQLEKSRRKWLPFIVGPKKYDEQIKFLEKRIETLDEIERKL